MITAKAAAAKRSDTLKEPEQQLETMQGFQQSGSSHSSTYCEQQGDREGEGEQCCCVTGLNDAVMQSD